MEQKHEEITTVHGDEYQFKGPIVKIETANTSSGAPGQQDIFANDEVAFLLDEIRGLESPALCNDNDQEYEIAGSQADLDLTLPLDSPYESSWSVHMYTFHE